MDKRESKDIYIRQNEKGMLNHLKAQRFVYLSAKKWITALFFCLILLPFTINIIINFVTNDIVISLLCLLSFILFCLGQLIRHIFKKKKFLAAGIQQRFDLYVLDLQDNCRKYIMHKMPNREDVIKALQKYKNKNDKKFLDWYSDYSKIPYEQTVFHCQKQNMKWTIKLKKGYIILLSVFFAMVLAGLIINSIINRDLLGRFILISLTLLPLFSYFVGGWQKLYKDIVAQKEIFILMQQTEKELNKLSEKKLNEIIEELQVEIYLYRQKAYIVPEWFYNITKKYFQRIENEIAKEISDQYQPKTKGTRNGKNY
jgi:hypothetical protein